MTTSETFGGYPPPPPPAPADRVLRRSRTGRVGAGVASGLGEYFGLDPVLFRVLFATSAFFAGAGILAYLIAWVAIPEQGTEHAPIDGWVHQLRRRRVPVWLVAFVGVVLLWVIAFSWWAPGPFFAVVAVVVLLVAFFGRRDLRTASAPRTVAPVDLSKPGSGDAPDEAGATAPLGATAPAGATASAGGPSWLRDTHAWIAESRAAQRIRRRRAMPLRIATLVALVVTLSVLGIIDSVTGIQLQVYFWTALGIVVTALLVGLVTRRTPWSMTSLIVPSLVGAIAFAGSHASLHDGVGQRDWMPTGVPSSDYRLAFGEGVLDLTALPTQSVPRTINVTVGAGRVKIIAPATMNLTVLANVHFGHVAVDGGSNSVGEDSGVGLSRTIAAPTTATGVPITVDVHLADGEVRIEHP